MFKRYEHRGHVLLQYSVTDIQVLPVPIQPKTFRFPNVHSTLRSMNRERFSRRSSTVGTGFITMKPKISHYAYRQGNSPRKYYYNFARMHKLVMLIISGSKHCIYTGQLVIYVT